jgi:hypothetical protein
LALPFWWVFRIRGPCAVVEGPEGLLAEVDAVQRRLRQVDVAGVEQLADVRKKNVSMSVAMWWPSASASIRRKILW